MKKILILIFILCSRFVLAQTQNIDSLNNELKKHLSEDTTRINLFRQLAFALHEVDFSKGLEMVDSSIALALKLNVPVKLADAYAVKGLCYSGGGNDSLAIVFYQKANDLYEKNKYNSGIAAVNHFMGISYYNQSDFTAALEYQQNALTLYHELKNLKGEAGCLNSIGIIYMQLGYYPVALDNFFKALKIDEQLNNKSGIAPRLSSVGLIYSHLKEYSKALDYYQKSLQISEELGDERGISRCYNNIANIYEALNDVNQAISYYNKALAINQRTNYKFGTASSFTNLGIAHFHSGMHKTALSYLEKSIPLFEELKDQDNLALIYEYLGEIYLTAPDSVLKQLKILPSDRLNKSLGFYRQSFDLYQKLGDIAGKADALEGLSNVYEAQKKTDLALSSYKQFIVLRDSVINNDNKTEIARKEMQFDFDKKESLLKADHDKKQALANAEIKRQRVIKNSVMGGTGILLIAAGAIFSFYKRRRDAVEQKKESDFKAEVSETEMKALRSQMNPHFIFNSLNSIGDYISRNDNKAADNYLSKFAKVMRMILENSQQKEVSLEDDLKALELYMQLESMRMNNKFTYEIKVDDAIDKENTLIPPLILQPFVENSIWHGISKKQGTGKITIIIKKEGDMINCIVEDDGIGRKKSALQQSGSTTAEKKSLGMKITKARIDIINKLKKSKAGVELSDLAEGLRVEVRLPLEMNF